MHYIRFIIHFLIHKFWVLRCGIATGVPLHLLLIHDWTKLLPWIAKEYAQMHRRGNSYSKTGSKSDFIRAKQAHFSMSPHHWQFWISYHHNPFKLMFTNLENDVIEFKRQAMPLIYKKEMLADWLAVERQRKGKFPKSAIRWEYFTDRIGNLVLTQKELEEMQNIVDTALIHLTLLCCPIQ